MLVWEIQEGTQGIRAGIQGMWVRKVKKKRCRKKEKDNKVDLAVVKNKNNW